MLSDATLEALRDSAGELATAEDQEELRRLAGVLSAYLIDVAQGNDVSPYTPRAIHAAFANLSAAVQERISDRANDVAQIALSAVANAASGVLRGPSI